MQVVAVLIAAAFAAIGLLPLTRAYFKQPAFWALMAVGIFAFPITQWINRTLWEPAAQMMGIAPEGLGLLLHLIVWAALAELFKFAPVLIVGAMTEAPARDWFAFGAASGAGFGLFGAQLVITLALTAARLPFTSVVTTVLAILIRFFPLLAHIATGALVAGSAARGRLVIALPVAVAVQTLLGVIDRGNPVLGTALAWTLEALVALFVFVYIWTSRGAPAAHPSRLQTQ